jgi:ubiquitin-activating enzyme E1
MENTIIQFAKKLYNFYFINEINIIIKEFPKDIKNKDGNLYWTGSKRFPHPILFDKNNELCQIFMKKIVLFLSNIFNIEKDESNINNHLSVIEVESFKFNENEKEKEEVLKNLYNEIIKKTNLQNLIKKIIHKFL